MRYLAEARRLGDLLIVALNSDASVRALKPDRPIVPQAERAEMLAALYMVDYVTIFDEETPYDTIKTLRPHVLVKGGDWKVEDIVGSDIVGETWSLPYVQNYSTTEIINKIIGKYAK